MLAYVIVLLSQDQHTKYDRPGGLNNKSFPHSVGWVSKRGFSGDALHASQRDFLPGALSLCTPDIARFPKERQALGLEPTLILLPL